MQLIECDRLQLIKTKGQQLIESEISAIDQLTRFIINECLVKMTNSELNRIFLVKFLMLSKWREISNEKKVISNEKKNKTMV